MNLTLTTQNTNSVSWMAAGLARMFPDRRVANYAYDYTYSYNFDASMAGIPFSICLLPVVSSVSPRIGGVAGGTVVTIRGSGFTTNSSRLVVYAAGERCDVISSTTTTIICTTRQAQAAVAANADNILNGDSFAVQSQRSYGSSGMWVKLWGCSSWVDLDIVQAYCPIVYDDSLLSLSFPWRNGFYLSLWYMFGQNWRSNVGLANERYTAVISTILTVPYSGYYTFYVNVDDAVKLYGYVMNSTSSVAPTASLLAYTSAWQPIGEFFNYPSQISKPVRLERGQRYSLQAKMVSPNFNII